MGRYLPRSTGPTIRDSSTPGLRRLPWREPYADAPSGPARQREAWMGDRLIFQLGTNNWQRGGEFAPGSGILH
jgi:hypothetical protein